MPGLGIGIVLSAHMMRSLKLLSGMTRLHSLAVTTLETFW